MNVYRDEGSLDFCLKRFRSIYPFVPVTVISDGSPFVLRARLIAESWGCGFHAGENLLVEDRGLAWWKRIFSLSVDEVTDIVLKIDPDTLFHREFRFVPLWDYFGCVKNLGLVTEHVQGGIQGFSMGMIRRVLGSGVLDDPLYTDVYKFSPNGVCADTFRAKYQISTDHSIHHVMSRLGVPACHWDEAGCTWLRAVENVGLRYAVTHPMVDKSRPVH